MSSGPTTVKPALAWYGVAVVLVVIGLLAAIGVGMSANDAFHETIQGFGRVPVGGSGVLDFDSAGRYSVFSELDSPQPQDGLGINIRVTAVRGGRPISTNVLSGHGTYDSGGQTGFGLGTVEIPKAGRYQVVTQRVSVPDTVVGSIAIGRDPFPLARSARIRALLVALLGFVAAGIAAFVVGLQRGRSWTRQGPVVATALPPATFSTAPSWAVSPSVPDTSTWAAPPAGPPIATGPPVAPGPAVAATPPSAGSPTSVAGPPTAPPAANAPSPPAFGPPPDAGGER